MRCLCLIRKWRFCPRIKSLADGKVTKELIRCNDWRGDEQDQDQDPDPDPDPDPPVPEVDFWSQLVALHTQQGGEADTQDTGNKPVAKQQNTLENYGFSGGRKEDAKVVSRKRSRRKGGSSGTPKLEKFGFGIKETSMISQGAPGASRSAPKGAGGGGEGAGGEVQGGEGGEVLSKERQRRRTGNGSPRAQGSAMDRAKTKKRKKMDDSKQN